MGEFYNPDKLYKGGSRNNSLINKKMIFRVLGVLLFIESAMFLLCAAVSLCYGEQDYQYFLYTLKSATPFPKCYLHKEKWTFDS